MQTRGGGRQGTPSPSHAATRRCRRRGREQGILPETLRAAAEPRDGANQLPPLLPATPDSVSLLPEYKAGGHFYKGRASEYQRRSPQGGGGAVAGVGLRQQRRAGGARSALGGGGQRTPRVSARRPSAGSTPSSLGNSPLALQTGDPGAGVGRRLSSWVPRPPLAAGGGGHVTQPKPIKSPLQTGGSAGGGGGGSGGEGERLPASRPQPGTYLAPESPAPLTILRNPCLRL